MTSLALKKFPRRSYFALQRAYYRCVCYQKNSVMYYFQKGERWKDKGTRVYRKYMQRCGVYYDRAMHHPVTTHPFCTHPLPEVDDVRLRGGVATATRNYARYCIHTGHIRGGGDRHAPRTSTGDCGEGRTKEKEAVIGAQRRQEGKKEGVRRRRETHPVMRSASWSWWCAWLFSLVRNSEHHILLHGARRRTLDAHDWRNKQTGRGSSGVSRRAMRVRGNHRATPARRTRTAPEKGYRDGGCFVLSENHMFSDFV